MWKKKYSSGHGTLPESSYHAMVGYLYTLHKTSENFAIFAVVPHPKILQAFPGSVPVVGETKVGLSPL